MDNGSTPPHGYTVPNGKPAANGSAASNGSGSLPLTARLLVAGARGARSVGRATGVDRAVEVVAEEAIVAAVESEAVERALARVLEGPVVVEAVEGALESDAVKRALLEAMDSELVDEVWKRLLASEEAQQLVERIAEAPEVRAAISAQGVGLLEDIGRTIGKLARRADDSFERIVRSVFFRRRRVVPTNRAGAVSRLLAFAIDGVIVNLGFSALAALAALVVSALGGNGNGISDLALLAGGAVWIGVGSLYLIAFWSLAGQTPGMRFLGIEIAQGRLLPRRSVARLFGLGLAVLSFGLGFLGIVFGERRRGLADRFARTDVVYDERRPEPAPWSQPPAGVPV
ncbi:MAG TPA: RDD family protein [Solirubrobacterales bacterium]|nr:RDD family protein [Solirubrobacterales bacterium]